MATVTIDQAFINAGTALQDNTTYVLSSNVIISSPFSYAGSGTGIVIDGSANCMVIPGGWTWPGLLVYNGTMADNIIKNLGIVSAGATLEPGAGWFYGTYTVRCQALFCYSTGPIGGFVDSQNCGGIFGSNCTGTAISCVSTGVINDLAGGIFGSNCTYTATACYSTGDLVGVAAGGIVANGGGNGTITNCYSTGDFIGTVGSSGISANIGSGTITNCYVTGTRSYYTNTYPIGRTVYTDITITNSGDSQGWSDSTANTYLTGYPGDTQHTQVWHSSASNTPYTCLSFPIVSVPDAPSVTATPGDGSVTLNWSAPPSNGSSITGYTVAVKNGNHFIGQTVSSSTFSYTYSSSIYDDISNTYIQFTNGTPRTFAVTAINSIGNGFQTLVQTTVGGTTAPDAPTSVQTTSTTQQITVSWTAPTSNGGTAITGYNIYSSADDYASVVGTATDVSASITGLSHGTFYAFKVSAVNAVGEGSLSTQSNNTTLVPFTATINQAFITAGTALQDYTHYTLTENITVTAPFSYAGTGAVVINGANYTVTVSNQSQWPGLFSKDVTVMNLGVVPSNSELIGLGYVARVPGWIFTGGSNGSATNCYVTGAIGQNAGGIFGEQSTGTAINCYSTGAIDTNAGGIFGQQSSGTAINCYSTGSIGQLAGGIFGFNSLSFTATNCYSTGELGAYANGIEANASSGTITSCGYSQGWSDASATMFLTGYPGDTQNDQVWYSVNANTPYKLSPTIPGAPTGVSATSNEDTQSTVSFTAPSNGGSAITSYTVTATPGGATATGTSSPIVVTGLTNGTTYRFHVLATNVTGNSAYSSYSSNATPLGTPSSPGLTVIPLYVSGKLAITITASTNKGGLHVNVAYTCQYKVTSADDSTYLPITLAGLNATVTGLTDDTSYTVRAYASNSAHSSSIVTATVTPACVPPVQSTTITAQNGVVSQTVQIMWYPVSGSGWTVTGYYVGTTMPVTPSRTVAASGPSAYVSGTVSYNTPTTFYLSTIAYRTGDATQRPYFSRYEPITYTVLDSTTQTNITNLTSSLAGKTASQVRIAVASALTSTNLAPATLSSYITRIGASNSSNISDAVFATVTTVLGKQLNVADSLSTLVATYNTIVTSDMMNGTAVKAAFVQALQGVTGYTSLPTTLTGANATAILNSVSNRDMTQTAPTSLTVYVPTTTSVTLSSLKACYIVMTPNTRYSITYRGFTNNLLFNSTTRTIDQYNGSGSKIASYLPGDSIAFSTFGSLQLYATGSLSGGGNEDVPCFPRGVRILTAEGYRAVETLKQQDLVVTADGRQVPVKIYGARIVTTDRTAPYHIPANALGPRTPSRDLRLSPDHAFQIRKGVWMLPRKAATLSEAVTQYDSDKTIVYYHLECPNYFRDNLVIEGGVVAESYAGSQANFKSPYTWSESLKGYTRSAPKTLAKVA